MILHDRHSQYLYNIHTHYTDIDRDGHEISRFGGLPRELYFPKGLYFPEARSAEGKYNHEGKYYYLGTTDTWYFYLLLLLLIWQSPGLPGWRKVNLITVTRRPLHPSIAAGFYCLTTSPGFLPALCEKWSGFFYVHMVWLSYTRDRRRLKVSSERLGNEDKAPCPRALLPGRGSNRGPPVWKSEVLTARPRQLLIRPGQYLVY